MFKDFREIVESPGFVSLTRSLGLFALVISVVERVSRNGNIGLTKTYTNKQRDSGDDKVITDVHIGLVSLEFSPDRFVNVPFVSYEIEKGEFIPKTPLAQKFLNLILGY